MVNTDGRVKVLDFGLAKNVSISEASGATLTDHSHLVSMRFECLPGLKQRLQAGKYARPSIGAGSVSGVIVGPLVMRYCYFGGFSLGHEFDGCA